MAKYADIIKVDAPSSAIDGATVIVDVSVKNIGTSDQNLAVTAVFDSTSFPFQFDYLLVSPGQTVIFRGSFTMPLKNVTITVWSWYWDGSEWVQDDLYEKQISLGQATSEFGSIEIIRYERR
ncbi:MAG: hypothetical protein H8D49_04740 [Dehalococcoidia bacterium]|nr:hypothetical protein [Dehalococcoidia bacterium]